MYLKAFLKIILSENRTECWDPDNVICNREKEDHTALFKEVGQGRRGARHQAGFCSNEKRLVGLQGRVSWLKDKKREVKNVMGMDITIVSNESCKKGSIR